MNCRLTAAALLAGALLPFAARGAGPDAPAPLLDEPSIAALAIALAVSPTPELDLAAGGDAAVGPEIEVVATVRARTVVFAERPRVRVSLTGEGPQRTRWRAERINLPARIEPGVPYRDVVVKLTLAGSPEQIQALLEDARRLSAGIRITPEAAAGAVPVPVTLPAAAPADSGPIGVR